MTESLDYIEAYFENTLTTEQRQSFERRCAEDEMFANEVAFYVSTRHALRSALLKDKQAYWSEGIAIQQPKTPAPVKKIFQQQWFRYAAAACLLLIGCLYFILKPQDPRTMALSYVDGHYLQLSQTMGATEDSMEMGKTAYNNKDYNRAVILFESVAKNHPENAEAKEYTGLVYLVTANYDKAIQSFDALANMGGLYSNPGLFLKAVTMILRNAPGDLSEAKGMLEEVVKKDLEGKEEAEKLLKKI